MGGGAIVSAHGESDLVQWPTTSGMSTSRESRSGASIASIIEITRLNLGCCDRHEPRSSGWLNVDICQPADFLADLTAPWPWPTSSIREIKAHDIIEHLPNKIHTMNELHRVLVPGGHVSIIVPSTSGAGAWCDPQHCSYWNLASFAYYEHNAYAHERLKVSYGIEACFKVLRLVEVEDSSHRCRVWKIEATLEAVKA